jgi:NAD(P)H dehydrogenase (quinone)
VNVLIILSHPKPQSFNHAIAHTIQQHAVRAGHTVWFHDLDSEKFDPVLTAAELERNAALPRDIELHCRQVGEADAIAVVHPNWWSAPPAILRGWTDRCLRAGRAYNFVPDGKGGAKAVGLLKARAALVLNTANTPQEIEESLLGDPLQTHWVRVVFGLCGITAVLRKNFTPLITSSPDQRAQWLDDTAHLTHQLLQLASPTRDTTLAS